MNHIFKSLLVIFLITGLWSCKKDENKVMFLGGDTPALKASTSGDVPLSLAAKSNPAIAFSWTNPNYKFNTGISSQDVNYILQFAAAGTSFNGQVQEVSVTKGLGASLTVGDLNTIMAKLGLPENISQKMIVRLKAFLANGSALLLSNEVSFSAIPYLDVAVPLPLTGNLYIIGDATPGGWGNPVPDPAQKFTKTNSTTFSITLALTGGKEFLIIPDNGSWANKYAVKDKNVPGLWQGGDFGYNLGDNIPAPAASGNYTIVLNFKTGKFTVTKQ
ncbi:MAG: SusE domain-containing protein [Ginsengibacter sp.]|jgi:hypothetical protein